MVQQNGVTQMGAKNGKQGVVKSGGISILQFGGHGQNLSLIHICFRCGFLGLLHLEIIIERLEREFDLDLITTAPSVEYRITLTDGTQLTIDNPTNYPDPAKIAKCEEPFVDAHIYTPTEYVGSLMELCQGRRGVMQMCIRDRASITQNRAA